MSRFGKGNHDILEQVNRTDRHGRYQTTTSRLPHKSAKRRFAGQPAVKLGRKKGKVLVGA